MSLVKKITCSVGAVVASTALAFAAAGAADAAVSIGAFNLPADVPISNSGIGASGTYTAILQGGDQNFVLYGPAGPVAFSGNLNSGVDRVAFQPNDCNFVGYAGTTAKWASFKTVANANGACRLTISDDGRLFITAPDGSELWDFQRDGVRPA